MNVRRRFPFPLLLSLLTVASSGAAQMPWSSSLRQGGVSLDILRPKFQGGGTSFVSVAAFFSARLPLGSTTVRIEVPYAGGATDLGSSSSLGNPYVGLELGGQTGFSGEAGARIPLASDDEDLATTIGWLSDITRAEAFLPNTLTLATRARYRVRAADGFTFDAGGGPSLWVPTKGGGDPELVLHHHMAAGYQGAAVWFAVGFGGWTIITEDAGGVGERTVNQIGASVGLARGQVRPALHLLVPLDDEYNSRIGMVLGMGVAVVLR